MSFHNLGLSKPLLDALAAKNYAEATLFEGVTQASRYHVEGGSVTET
jgi:hypothetical protein